MKRALLSITTVLLLGVSTFAADWATAEGSCFAKGDMNLNAGLIIFVGAGASFEYAIMDAISVGGATGYYANFHPHWTDHYIPVMLRGSFHPFNLKVLADKIKIRDKMDVYLGLSAGWPIGFVTTDLPITPSVTFQFPVREHIGMRYYFSPTFGVYAEEGGALGYLNGGVALKF